MSDGLLAEAEWNLAQMADEPPTRGELDAFTARVIGDKVDA